ncbi:serine/arginine repetitive matrix protein 1-like [Phyllostomus discolor]|uniref:Serine/arginine repetitive matrix protein 1-like n=1 Tax=Phyllostomus discolor TaxID=89673 RepID=A0A6J2MH30_9CHIR|nr:serine/arginine repetitive matrix protein 1-like [Phyllostomus discolor]
MPATEGPGRIQPFPLHRASAGPPRRSPGLGSQGRSCPRAPQSQRDPWERRAGPEAAPPPSTRSVPVSASWLDKPGQEPLLSVGDRARRRPTDVPERSRGRGVTLLCAGTADSALWRLRRWNDGADRTRAESSERRRTRPREAAQGPGPPCVVSSSPIVRGSPGAPGSPPRSRRARRGSAGQWQVWTVTAENRVPFRPGSRKMPLIRARRWDFRGAARRPGAPTCSPGAVSPPPRDSTWTPPSRRALASGLPSPHAVSFLRIPGPNAGPRWAASKQEPGDLAAARGGGHDLPVTRSIPASRRLIEELHPSVRDESELHDSPGGKRLRGAISRPRWSLLELALRGGSRGRPPQTTLHGRPRPRRRAGVSAQAGAERLQTESLRRSRSRRLDSGPLGSRDPSPGLRLLRLPSSSVPRRPDPQLPPCGHPRALGWRLCLRHRAAPPRGVSARSRAGQEPAPGVRGHLVQPDLSVTEYVGKTPYPNKGASRSPGRTRAGGGALCGPGSPPPPPGSAALAHHPSAVTLPGPARALHRLIQGPARALHRLVRWERGGRKNGGIAGQAPRRGHSSLPSAEQPLRTAPPPNRRPRRVSRHKGSSTSPEQLLEDLGCRPPPAPKAAWDQPQLHLIGPPEPPQPAGPALSPTRSRVDARLRPLRRPLPWVPTALGLPGTASPRGPLEEPWLERETEQQGGDKHIGFVESDFLREAPGELKQQEQQRPAAHAGPPARPPSPRRQTEGRAFVSPSDQSLEETHVHPGLCAVVGTYEIVATNLEVRERTGRGGVSLPREGPRGAAAAGTRTEDGPEGPPEPLRDGQGARAPRCAPTGTSPSGDSRREPLGRFQRRCGGPRKPNCVHIGSPDPAARTSSGSCPAPVGGRSGSRTLHGGIAGETPQSPVELKTRRKHRARAPGSSPELRPPRRTEGVLTASAPLVAGGLLLAVGARPHAPRTHTTAAAGARPTGTAAAGARG